jgi:hypothetical protein
MKKRTKCDYLLKTDRQDVAEILRKYGYTFMYMEGQFYVFADTGDELPVQFDDRGVIYSNMMCL